MNEEATDLRARVRNDLLDIGADWRRPACGGLKVEPLRFSEEQVAGIEAMVEQHEAELPARRAFVAPGGTRGAAAFHIAPSIVRRAEREIVEVAFRERINRGVNRPSDLPFVLARIEHRRGGAEMLRQPGDHRPSADQGR